MIGSLPKLIALLMVLLLVGSTFVGGIIYLYKGVRKDDPTSIILIEKGEEGKSKAMFEDPAVKPLIEGAGHIYDSTVISSYF